MIEQKYLRIILEALALYKIEARAQGFEYHRGRRIYLCKECGCERDVEDHGTYCTTGKRLFDYDVTITCIQRLIEK